MAASAERSAGFPASLAMVLGVGAGLAALAGQLALLGLVIFLLSAGLAWYFLQPMQTGTELLLASLLLLPPLPFALGDTGPHPALVVAFLCGMAALVRWPEYRCPIAPITASWAALLAAMSLSIGWAMVYSGITIAAGSASRLVLFAIAPFVFFTAAYGPGRQAPEEALRFSRWLFAFAVAAACFGVLDFFYQLPTPAGYEPQFIWLDSGVYRRAQGLFYESSTLGNFCAFFLVMVAVALTEERRRTVLTTAGLWLGGGVLAVALLLSYSRAAVVAVLLSMLALAIVRRRGWIPLRLLVLLIACAAVTTAGAAVLFPEVIRGYLARLDFSFQNLWATPDRVLSGRLDSWQILARFIAEHPWQTVFGIGYKTLPYTAHLGKPLIADNTYISTLVETGVAGLAALLSLHVSVLTMSWRLRKHRRYSFFATWLFCFWIGESVQMLSGDLLTYWRLWPVFAWLMAQVARGAQADADSCT